MGPTLRVAMNKTINRLMADADTVVLSQIVGRLFRTQVLFDECNYLFRHVTFDLGIDIRQLYISIAFAPTIQVASSVMGIQIGLWEPVAPDFA